MIILPFLELFTCELPDRRIEDIIYLLMFIICPGTSRFLIDCVNSLAQIAGAIKLVSTNLRYSDVGVSVITLQRIC